MEPVPSTVTKTYPPRGPLQQFRFADGTAFNCFRCGEPKKSKLITVYGGDWSRRLCNGCYGRLLSLYDVKAGTLPEDQKAEELACNLLTIVSADDVRRAELLFKTSERRAELLSPESLRFIATAEHVASQLQEFPQLEWSPAIIGLCKAVESEIVSRVLRPLVSHFSMGEVNNEKADKDIGRIAAFCCDPTRKPPEIGVFAHFLQTVIHSQDRRSTSRLIAGFLNLLSEWVNSHWLLRPEGCHAALVQLTSQFRNRAAHIDELGNADYIQCRQLVAGPNGILWELILATSTPR